MRLVSINGNILLLVLAKRLNIPHQKQDVDSSNARDRLIEQISDKMNADDLFLIGRYFIPSLTKEKLNKKEPQEVLQEVVERFSWSVPEFVCSITLVSIMLNLVGCAAYQLLDEKQSFGFPIERLALFKPGQYNQDLCFAEDLSWVYMVFESRNQHSIFKPLFKVLGRKITHGLAVNYLHLELFFEAKRPVIYLIFNFLQIECQQIRDSSEKIFWMLITDGYKQSASAISSFTTEEQTRFAIIQALHALQKLERHEQVKKLQQDLAQVSFVRLVMRGFDEALQNVGSDIIARRAIIAHLVLQRPKYHRGFFLRLTRQYVLSIFETSRLDGSQPDSAFQLAAMAKLKYLENEPDSMQLIRLFTDALKEEQYAALRRILSVATPNELTCMYLITILASHLDVIHYDNYSSIITHLANCVRLTPKLVHVNLATPRHFIEIIRDAKNAGLYSMSAVMILTESCLKLSCNNGASSQLTWKSKQDLLIASNALPAELQFLFTRAEPFLGQHGLFWPAIYTREQETFDTTESFATRSQSFFPLHENDSWKPTSPESPIDDVSVYGYTRIRDASLDDLRHQPKVASGTLLFKYILSDAQDRTTNASEYHSHGFSDTTAEASRQPDFSFF